ncbi:Hypothetical predicted protein [Olea europaea subsp. europaea]|uniref:Uncharacterized protein n=1 Tax=Olea europaea subsp. europaea TaxID=158383 RepID=A0A8S0RQS0_OLEEU|nr:Hypothetical predicted protein [Olea europaea subsp. europaea]
MEKIFPEFGDHDVEEVLQQQQYERFSAYVDESWWEDIEQFTLDEALARSLQLQDYSGDDPDLLVTSQIRRQDNINPDNMTCEELLSLDEASGNEHKGLSVHLISQLPTFRYKAGSSARKREEKE